MKVALRLAGLALAATCAAPALASPVPFLCAAPAALPALEPGTPYYDIELVPTGRVPGTRRAAGLARVNSTGSPFGVAVTSSGRYSVDLAVSFRGLVPRARDFAVWVATADLSEIHYIGVLDEAGNLKAEASWNKFLVIVTLEANGAEPGESWDGPIVFRGMSRSGRMHTMAGHGPFQAEACAKYGY
ncbi:MAG: hypothetical protein GKS06_06390 [Acidobacteria bacterium]|nr:hypothetical protein [Acidobacteriota bacterium]